MLVMAHRFAESGYIVVAPHYRGSNGWAGKDELGGADLHDLMLMPAIVARIPGADSSRLQYEKDRETLYRTRSAMRFADRLTKPILIMHGDAATIAWFKAE